MARKKTVAVVIPIYHPTLSPSDRISLSKTYHMLHQHPQFAVCPEGMDISVIKEQYPQLRFISFSPSYFQDIEGYNRLMLAQEFYEAFDRFEYILIAQLDTYIFKDELVYWCKKGYDYIGAPWLRRDLYDKPVLKQCIRCYQLINKLLGRRSHFDRYGRVGNGGLSLRKVDSHLRALLENPEKVVVYAITKNRQHLYNEDVFWAMEVPWFRYPSIDEAMLFAYNKYPELSFERTGGKLPFGCHGWTKPKYGRFWIKYGLISHDFLEYTH